MSALPAGVINLTAPGGQPRPPPGARVPPPPPMHHGPPAMRPPVEKQPARPPMGGRVMPGHPMAGPPAPQADPRPPMHLPRQVPVPPPHEVIPPELRRRQLVEHSDLRGERMTEADAREALSEYVVYRLEKVSDPNEVDDEGYPVKPTWENIRRIEVRDLSRSDIIRRIRELNAEGRTALQKKTDLTPNQQLQIEKAQDVLEARNTDRRFRYTLQQISPKMKKIPKESYQYQQIMADREAKKVVIAKGKLSTSKERKSKKNLIETVALMVYFKKEPRLEENAMAILAGKKNDEVIRQQKDIQARQHQQLLQQQEHELRMHHERQMHHERLHPQHHPQALPQRLPPPPPMKALQNGKAGKAAKPAMVHVVQTGPKPHQVKTYSLSASSSQSSRSSDYSDSSRSDTEYTPTSSITGSSESTRHGRRRHRSRGRSRSRSRSHSRRRHHDRPEQYGVPRHHTKYDQHYFIGTDMPRERLIAVPTSPTALPMGRGREFLEDDAFIPRRISGRAVYALEDVEEPLPVLRRRSGLPARVVQGDLNFRPVGPQEVVRQRHEDDLHNVRLLNLQEEVRFDEQRRDEEEWAAEREEFDSRNRRHMERRFRRPSLDRRALFQQVPAETYEEEAARDYMRHSRERSARPALDNPFASLGRGARRNSFGVAGY